MKKKTKKIMAFICSLFFVLQPLVYVSAATVPPMEGIKAYTISNGNVYTYTAIDGAYSGYISGSVDLCNIVKVYDSGWCKVSYPTSRGTKTAYTKSSNFFTNLNFSNTYVQLGKNLIVYRKKTGNQRIGSVYSTDSVLIIGQSNNRTQIVYPAGNRYKMGWISGVYSVNGEQSADVKDGYYQIKSSINSDYVIDVYGGRNDDGSNVQLYKNQCSLNQGFNIKKQSDGYYTITALHSGKALDVENGGAYDGANVLQWTLNGGDNQKWKIVKTSDGFYSFISKCSGLYLDANGAKAENEVNIQCWTGNGTKAQKFMLEACSINGSEYQDTEQVEKTTSDFQLPLLDARCSWRSSNNWSWGENANGGGYSSARVYHLGVDMVGSDDSVFATSNGVVVKSGWNNANGNYIVIQHDLSGKTIYSFYAHLSSREVSVGTTVLKGQKIGIVGNTGSSSRGKHLHFAMIDTLWNGSYYGYSTYFTGDMRAYGGVTYYNPIYVINNGRLP